MRLMLLCCTWKDEHMGEDEGEERPRAAWRREGGAAMETCPPLLEMQRMLRV